LNRKKGLKIKSRPIDRPPFKGRIAESVATPSFIAAISDCRGLLASPAAEILLDTRNKVGALPIALETGKAVETVIKAYSSRGIVKFKSLVEPSKAAKAWRGACGLIERGLQTPLPLAWLEERKRGLVAQSFFLSERIYGGREIRDLFKEPTADDLRPLLAVLARSLWFCHENGILHRDLSDGNILVKMDDGAEGDVHFYFLDTNRIRIHEHKKVGLLARAKNLIRLGIPPAQQLSFLEQYAGAGGRAPSRLFVFWYRLNKTIFSGYIRLKKKLKLKRLARTLRIQ
jgi:serine/threonine protein kinase